jgi:hypothetical protein
MAADQTTTIEAIFNLPITGRRNGRKGVVIGHTKVRDDAFTHEELARYRWNFNANGYAWRNPTGQRQGVRGVIFLHRVVYEHYFGAIPSGMVIDHIDRNPLNNLPSNLRISTHSRNSANRGRNRNNTSGYSGVAWCEKPRRWRARLMVERRHVYLGYFAEAQDAALAVNDAYRRYFPGIPIPNPEAEDIRRVQC